MANYHPAECAYCHAETWCETRRNGKPQCRGCKIERFYSEVLYPPLGYKLMEWQKTVLRNLYGVVAPEDGRRRYQSAYVSVAKKNGKSFLIGGLPIYHLLMEDEIKPEAYGAAAAKDQAALVYKSAAQLIAANPDLQARLRVLPSTKRIVRRDGGGFYAVLSADGDVQDGIEPSLSIRDEVHRWKTLRAETLYDVMTKGQISRREPLDLAITTAGAEFESALWFREHEYATKVLNGSLQSDHFYAAIWSADSKRIEAEPEYWKSREARVAANPSHEDLGGFLRDQALVKELDKAIAEPSEKWKFYRYNLNIPLKVLEDPVIDIVQWQACGGGVDLRTWPVYDVELLVRKWGLFEKPCWAGVDASWSDDLTAVVFLFPPADEHDVLTVLPFFWAPEGQVAGIEQRCKVPLRKWVEQGFIETTNGLAIDLHPVKQRIHWGAQLFDLQEIAYDKLNFRYVAEELFNEGLHPVEVNQGFLELSEPTKHLLSLYPDRKMRHGNNPVLNWMASCVQLRYDHKDNCMPVKPHRKKLAYRVDGFQAMATCCNRMRFAEDREISIPGLRSVGSN